MSLFEQIREPCVRLSRVAFLPPSVFDPNSHELLSALRDVDQTLSRLQQNPELATEFTPKVADYIFTPVASLLKQKSLADGSVRYVLSIIAALLQTSWATKGAFPDELAAQLLPVVAYLINPTKEDKDLQDKQIEFKNAAALVLLRFFQAVDVQGYNEPFFSTDRGTMPVMAHTVTMLLDIFVNCMQYPDTQLTCLDALSILYNNLLHDGETLSYILPGNVSSMAKVLVAPGRSANFTVVVKILNLLESLLVQVYDDLELNAQTSAIHDVKDLVDETGEVKEFSNEVTINPRTNDKHRNNSWLRATSAQVNLALQGFIPKLIKRDNTSIRAALTSFSRNIIVRCASSLEVCKPILVSVFLKLKVDPDAILQSNKQLLVQHINNELTRLHTNIEFDNSDDIDVLEFTIEKFSQYSTNQNVLMDVTDVILETLNADNDNNALISKKKNDIIIQQSSNVIVSDKFNISKSNKKVSIFDRFTKETETNLQSLLRKIGMSLAQKSELTDAIESVISSMDTSKELPHRVNTLWVATAMLQGMVEVDPHDNEIDQYLSFGDEDEKNLVQTSEDSNEPCFVVLEFASNVADDVAILAEGKGLTSEQESAMCSVLSSIDTVAGIMGDSFADELIDYIYVVIDSLASSSPRVRDAAQICASTIAKELYAGDIKELISDNMDYLIDSISKRLNSGMTDRVTTVLMVIYKLVGYKALESFSDILETIFQLIDYYHGYAELCLQFFQLFKVIVIQMKYAYMDNDIPALGDDHLTRSTFAPWGIKNTSQLLRILDKTGQSDEIVNGQTDIEIKKGEPQNFQEYFDQKLKEQQPDSDDEEDEGDGGINPDGVKSEDETPWTSPIPKESYRILLQIFAYGDRLLKHDSKPLRVTILDVNSLVVPLLASQYNSMLPQIAQVWDSAVQCTLDSDYSIVNSACHFISEMIHYSGDFLSSRFIDLWSLLGDKCVLLKEVRSRRGIVSQNNKTVSNGSTDVLSVGTHIKLPPLVSNAMISLSNMLLEGISFTELQLQETTLLAMLSYCSTVIPPNEISTKSLHIGDIIWKIQSNLS